MFRLSWKFSGVFRMVAWKALPFWKMARMSPFALRQAKRAVNQTLDVQGFYAAIQSVFDIHQTGHGNALSVGGWPVLVNLDEMKANIQ